MIDKKIFAGGKMNKDDDQHLLPKNDWVDARNVRINSTADGYLGSFSNMKGMDLLYTLPASIEPSTVIGAKGFDYTNKIYFFVADPNGFNKVIEYNGATNTTTIIIEDLTDTGGIPVLNFSTSYRINHIDLLDGRYLLWTDGFNAPRYYDLSKNYGVITDRDISMIKYAPNTPPTNLAVIDNPAILANKIKDTNYQFAYRWIYWDNSKSTFSPISDVSNQKGRASGALSKGLPEWYSSSLKFNYEGGGDLVKGVDIMSRIGNTGDWAIINSLDYEKGDFRISYAINLTLNDIPREYFISVTYGGTTYNFGGTYTSTTTSNIYNSIKTNFNALGLTGLTATLYQSGTNYLSQSQYLVITSNSKNVQFSVQTTRPQFVNVAQTGYLQSNAQTNTYVFTDFQPVNIIDQSEASRPFDYVPLKAEAQALANGNHVVYGNYTEGYNNVDITASAAKVIKTLNNSNFAVTQATVVIPGVGTFVNFTFTGTPIEGDVFVITRWNPTDKQYTYSIPKEDGETAFNFVERIAFLLGIYFETPAKVSWNGSNLVQIDWDGVEKKYNAGIINANTVQGLKTGDEYQYGLVYIDVAGRYGAVNTSQSLVVNSNPLDKYNNNIWSYVTGQITVQSRPPLWADKYAVVRTKRKKIDFFLDIFAESIVINDVSSSINIQAALLEYNERYGANLSYSWIKGDRIRFINTSSINTGDLIVLDTEITSVDDEGKLIISSNSTPKDMSGSGYNYSFFCEIYRSSAVSNDTLFWEISEMGDIGNKGLVNCYHKKIYTTAGNQDQSSSSPSVTPLIHISETGDVWYKNRFLPLPTILYPYVGRYYEAWCESPSFSDFNANTFTTDAGRANQQNAFEKQVVYNSTVRFGNGYVVGTQINNINSFSNESYQDYSNLYGAIQKLDIDGSVMIVGQKLRLGRVRVFEKLVIDKVDDTLVSNSENLLNGIVYYDFEAGIGDSPEAYVRAGSKVYGVDKNRGIVWRLAQNGITPISITAKMNTYFRAYLRTATVVRGGFDPKNQEYVIYSLAGSLSGTVIFSENSDGFTSFLDIVPNYFATLKNDLYSFGGDKFYRHNATNAYGNFYGTNYDATVTIVSNESPITKKSFIAINEVTNDTWDATEINTSLSQTSSLLESDFAVLEGESHAAFLRDSRTTPGVTYPLLNGDQLKGKWIKVKLRNNSTNFVYLLSVGIKYVQSPQTGL
jgi:hypothetical protein